MAIFTNSHKNQCCKTFQMQTVQAHSRQKWHVKGNTGLPLHGSLHMFLFATSSTQGWCYCCAYGLD